MRTWVLAALCIAFTGSVASAETAETLAREGEERARLGQLPEAIALFKQADALDPRASHACLIGLAYLRRERWAQAELYFGQCRERTPTSEALPDWLVLAERQLDDHLRAANFAAVDIRVEPHDLAAEVSVSSFAPDEQFGPRRIYLPYGRHVVTGTAPGHTRVQATISITDRSPRQVVLRYAGAEAASGSRSRVLPWTITAVGGSLVVAGALVHAFGVKPVRDSLVTAGNPEHPDPALYDRNSEVFDRRRQIAVGLYGVGAAAVLTGVVLRYTVYRDSPESSVPRVSAQLRDRGAVVGIEWQR
ncbi:MAG: hypothetical protein H0T79_05365 [Deltaproteobacteria bacterium]|nr:hypothetical protein [Deltaproteobacteria bacterium]